MEPAALAIGLFVILGGGIGCIPLVLLFVDYRKRGEIHKPFIYLAAFGLTFAVLLPFLLTAFGLWLARSSVRARDPALTWPLDPRSPY